MYLAAEISRLREKLMNAHEAGDYGSAIDAAQIIMDIYKSNDINSGSEYAGDTYNLAVLYDETGQYHEAIELYRESARARECEYGKQSQPYADAVCNMAASMACIGNFEEAKGLFEQAYMIRRELLGPSHRDTLEALFNYAGCSEDLGDYSGAERIYLRLIKHFSIMEVQPAESFTDLYIGLAVNQSKQGKIKEALKNIEKAEKALAAGSGDLKESFRVLMAKAQIYFRGDCGEEAADIMDELYDIKEELSAQKDEDYLDFLREYAFLMSSIGEFEEAMEKFLEYRYIIVKTGLDDEEPYNTLMMNEAWMLAEIGRREKIRAMGENLLGRITEAAEKNENYKFFLIINKTLETVCSYDEAVLSQVAAGMFAGERNDTGPVAKSEFFKMMGRMYCCLQDPASGIKKYLKAAAVLEADGNKIPGRFVRGKADAYACAAFAYLQDVKPKKALKNMIYAEFLAQSRFAPDSFVFAKLNLDKARLLKKMRNFDEALDCVLRAIRIYRNNLPGECSIIHSAELLQAELYLDMEKYDNARKIYARIMDHEALGSRRSWLRKVEAFVGAAKALAAKGIRKTAEEYFRRALELYEEYGLDDSRRYIGALSAYSEFLMRKSGEEIYSFYMQYGGSLRKKNGCEMLFELGALLADQIGDIRGAQIYLGEYMKELCRTQTEEKNIFEAFCMTGKVLREHDTVASANFLVKTAEIIQEAIEDHAKMARLLIREGDIFVRENAVDEACTLYVAAMDYYEVFEEGFCPEKLKAMGKLAYLKSGKEDIKRAMELFEEIYAADIKFPDKKIMLKKWKKELVRIYKKLGESEKAQKVINGEEL
ncbi:MAG: tetratricopeptide repeat protein [Firmicutes bacterium]|nr:tetratricopeptide repeat protein [Bacillota bacterium]